MKGPLVQFMGMSILCVACSGDPGATRSTTSPLAGCEPVDGGGCPALVPSFAKDVLPLLNRDCNRTCHAPGMAQWPLVSYPDVNDWAALVRIDVDDCAMPPADAGALTSDERTMLLGWIACGAPNN